MVVGRGEKPILRILLEFFWGEVSCWNDIPPKGAKLSWNHQVHAMRDREKEGTHTIARKGTMADKQTK